MMHVLWYGLNLGWNEVVVWSEVERGCESELSVYNLLYERQNFKRVCLEAVYVAI